MVSVDGVSWTNNHLALGKNFTIRSSLVETILFKFIFIISIFLILLLRPPQIRIKAGLTPAFWNKILA